MSCNNYFNDNIVALLPLLTWINNLLILCSLNSTNSFTPHQKLELFLAIVKFIAVGSRSCMSPRHLLPQEERPMNQKTAEQWEKKNWPVFQKWVFHQHRQGTGDNNVSMRQRLQQFLGSILWFSFSASLLPSVLFLSESLCDFAGYISKNQTMRNSIGWTSCPQWINCKEKKMKTKKWWEETIH
jgi:hypothetical protein